MAKFLGEKLIGGPNYEGTPYAFFTEKEWIFEYICTYGNIDGAHHKQWLLDQITRILCGTPVIVSLAEWDDGTKEYRFNTGEPSKFYKDWVYLLIKDGYEPLEEGIAP